MRIEPKMRGDVLDNGATLLHHQGGIVMAKYHDEFVTWALCLRGYTEHGNYFKTSKEAWTDFIRRVAEEERRR